MQKQAPATQGVTGSGPAAALGFMNSSLYVGDLEASVDESKLFDLFNHVAPVVSVRVCRDQTRSASLGYGYVNFSTPLDASNAKEILNFTPVDGKPIRVMFSNRDPSLRKSGFANLFIKNLDQSIDNKALYDTFAAFGTVLSCKVAVDSNSVSKGYGFVQFEKEEAAQNAIKRLDGMLINDKKVQVVTFVHRQERNQGKGSPKFTNVYVKNFSESTTDEDLRHMFERFGSITSAVVMKDANGKTRCFGFVNFETPEAASAAIENMNGSASNGKSLYVGKAESKATREAKLKAKFEQERNSRFEKLKGCNLYLKNLDDAINEENLKELFSEFGSITSCKIMLDQNGDSKGSGFVAFSTTEEAAKALKEMNGKMIRRKPLYVAVAQRKDERKAWLQAHFAQIQTSGAMSPLPGIHGFQPGAPRLDHQQLYFGQVGPGLIPQPSGYGFQQQHLPGLRPGVPSNFVMSFQLPHQGPSGQRMGPRRGLNFHQQRNSSQSPDGYMTTDQTSMSPQMIPQALMAPMMPFPLDTSGPPAATSVNMSNSGPLSKSVLASVLASTTPENQRTLLGEHLYPLVERLEPNHARKVTGMLLEMDQTEVLHLIESPEALSKKIMEAMDVLSNGNQRSQAEVQRLSAAK